MIEKFLAAIVLCLGIYAFYSKKPRFALVSELCLVSVVSLAILPKAVSEALSIFVLGVCIVLVFYRVKLQKRIPSATPPEKYRWPKRFFRLSGALFLLAVSEITRRSAGSHDFSLEIEKVSQHDLYFVVVSLFLAGMYLKRKANWKN